MEVLNEFDYAWQRPDGRPECVLAFSKFCEEGVDGKVLWKIGEEREQMRRGISLSYITVSRLLSMSAG